MKQWRVHGTRRSAIPNIAAAACFAAATGAWLPAAEAQRHDPKPPPSTAGPSGGKTVSRERKPRVPAALVGTWTWGSVNPGRYVNKSTGEYLGHAGGGAISYTFAADGVHKRYVLIHFGAGFSNESTFSAMDGTADFDEAAGTFSVRFSRGQITFEKKRGMEKRPLSREDMERGGTVFTYRLGKDEAGTPVLYVNEAGKPATEGRRFYRDEEASK